MVTYKASDLVTAAMKLADLENTSFVSASENRMYINQAWNELYQQAIDNGELFWLKDTSYPFEHTVQTEAANPDYDPRETIPNPDYDPEDPESSETIPNPNYDPRETITVTTVVTNNTLPDDFYQLYNIEDENENLISRKTKNDTKADQWYWIKGNELLLSHVKGAKIYYYPEPMTLDITEQGDTDLSYPKQILYTLMVLKLAEYYKIRQNADISGIEMLLNDAWKQYYDMLSRDNNETNIIRDVYAGKRRFY